MRYCESYCEEKGISTSQLNEAQRTLHYIAENMKMEKSISEDGYKHFQMAIKALETVSCIKEKCAYCPHCENCDVDDETLEIKALEQTQKTWGLDDAREDFIHDVYNTLDFLPTNNEANRIIDSFDRVTSGLKQQPCEDAVSRQAVLDALHVEGRPTKRFDYVIEVQRDIEALPSATPEEKTGRWILTDVEGNRVWHCNCSECGKDPQDYIGGSENWWMIKNKLPKYCPNCGIRMVSE